MSLKPWREIAQPHKDVLEGTFKQSEFAADISQVANGTAPPEYQDAVQFFARTFITEGMRLLLTSVAQRLAGQGGDPVIQLQTAFGGGKTHTMLAVYHLAARAAPPGELEGIPPILDAAGITHLPQARVAMIDGIALSPSQAQVKRDGQKVTTLWGELAWQLLGTEGAELLRESDEQGTSPGKTLLVELLQRAAPCVILIDELVAFLRQFAPGQQYRAGTFDANLSFIQALTEALKAVPNAILLASLPESELEVGGTQGQRTLNALEKYFARVESVWKPVAAEEAFEIVRRRLFAHAGDPTQVEAVCRRFADFYRAHPERFPSQTQTDRYAERLRQSYPIHPEIFDRLYEDWSTLEKFQRTRGVLQYLAIVIHRLWNSDNRDALIMPGSIALDDSTVRNKSIHYLPQGWEPVLEREVDGHQSTAYQLDSQDTRFGSVQAARRTLRTIFLGSAPAGAGQKVRGIEVANILLGAAQPEQTLGVFEDVLKRLRDRLHYLYTDQDRFWLDTRPNLRREMESRMQRLDQQTEVWPLLRKRLGGLFGKSGVLTGVHVFADSADVPDEYGTGPRLVVLSPKGGYSRADARLAEGAAEKILTRRGEQPRQKRNRLLFLAPDFDVLSGLYEAARSLLAWEGIVADVEDERLNLTLHEAKLARSSREQADKGLQRMLRETYKWLLCPTEDFVRGAPTLSWEVVALSPAASNLVAEIERRLQEEEWVITQWSPIHLKNVLERWYFKEQITEVGALKVYQDCCHYLYLPRIQNDSVFKATLQQAMASEDFFGVAAGKEDERYLGLTFGHAGPLTLDASTLLVQRDAAQAYVDAQRAAQGAAAGGGFGSPGAGGTAGSGAGTHTAPGGVPGGLPGATGAPSGAGYGGTSTGYPGAGTSPAGSSGAGTVTTYPGAGTAPAGKSGTATPPPDKRRFYGSLELDPVRAKLAFMQLHDEIIEQLTARMGMQVRITVEIEAETAQGFDDNLQRTLRENARVLKFTNAEFEE